MVAAGVGIGTTAPNALLDVYNNGGASGTTQANITNFAGGATTTNSSALNLRIQGAGGGMVDNQISAQYNSSGAGNYSITLKPGGTTVMTAVGNGNVGIGTTVPTSNLQIYGTGGASSTTTMTITNSSNSNTGYGAQLLFNNIAGANTFSLAQISALRDNNAVNYGAYMAFYTTNGDVYSTFSERMRISPGGNVGIGTTVPNGALHIYGPSQSTLLSDNYILNVTSASCFNGNGSVTVYSNSINLQAGDLTGMASPSRGAQLYIGGGYSINSAINHGQIIMYTGAAERMRVATNGNVGIGTAAPTSSLHVYGLGGANSTTTLTVSNSSNSNTGYGAQLLFNNGPSGATYPLGQMSVLRNNAASDYSAYMSFHTTPDGVTSSLVERMRLASNGNVLINTTAAFGNGVIQVVSGDGSTQDGMSCKAKYDGNNVYASHNTSGTYRGGMNGVNSSSVTFATSSDRRLKDNIHRIEGSLAIVNQLVPVHFRWINDDQYDFGFIAQEVYKVLPHLRPNFSSYIKDCTCLKNDLWNGVLCNHCVSMNDEPVDENGKPRYYSLDYGKFTPYLLGAIQELTGRTVELESDNVSLKSRVAGLLAWAQTQGFSG